MISDDQLKLVLGERCQSTSFSKSVVHLPPKTNIIPILQFTKYQKNYYRNYFGIFNMWQVCCYNIMLTPNEEIVCTPLGQLMYCSLWKSICNNLQTFGYNYVYITQTNSYAGRSAPLKNVLIKGFNFYSFCIRFLQLCFV